jgi:hypothetical protein
VDQERKTPQLPASKVFDDGLQSEGPSAANLRGALIFRVIIGH